MTASKGRAVKHEPKQRIPDNFVAPSMSLADEPEDEPVDTGAYPTTLFQPLTTVHVRRCFNVQCRVQTFVADNSHLSLNGCPVCMQPGAGTSDTLV